MKVKIEFTNGNIEVAKVDVVAFRREEGTAFTRRTNSRYDFDYKLEEIARITVDNEIIYDFTGRKERYKKEEAKENEENIKKYCFGIE